ncbi:MAG: tRNA preQ1(34) S-adenosylmethionine ribosyltransferase-isomerase QueA [Candidatus Omnitrophica bacterium]|nr:tRNA preQ1(34) S-adenosylmethionine ribosyltransferase-isomerase QueA [Candidatus Omnitrophota bacterium]
MSLPRRTVLPINKIFQLKSYDYPLPEALIAQEPLSQRDKCRLLVIDRREGTIRHGVFSRLSDYLPEKSSLVVNNSKVIPARLLGKRKTGGAVEIFLLKALGDGHRFEALLRPLKKIREGEEIDLGRGISAKLEDKLKRTVSFNKKDIIKHLARVGHIPLPPYIKRPDTPADQKDYQTVYASRPGSVASPTAGLHFTKELMAGLKSRGHGFLELTLHINYGTFKPVECDDIRQHPIHTESYSLKPAVYDKILKAKDGGKPVVAVGTTSLRVLESVAQTGVYEGATNLFIYPGYDFKMADALITNFHLPRSTLLMLVCAFGGHDLIMEAYRQAVKERYRFYSYGDAMLIL